MKAGEGRRYRLHPGPDQAATLIRWGHTCRALWNLGLEQRRFAFEQRGVTLRFYDQCAHLTQARAELPWLADLPAQSAQQVLRHLDRAYDNWWNPEHPAHAPDFKKRSARLPNATVTVDGSGTWHISFGVHTGARAAPANGLPGCGVDFGVACSAYVSNEATPRLMAPTLTVGEKARKLGLERRKARQIAYAKKRNGGTYSRRLRRTITELAKLSSRQTHRRQDFTHKLTTELAKNHGWVGVEDLKVANMTASARGTAGAPGLVPPAFTSQDCPACGVRDKDSRPGCGRIFACTSCGHADHADRNAAINIENRARRAGGPNSTRRHLLPSPRPAGRRIREPLAGAA